MGSLTFIGLGLNDERGITLEGLEEAHRAECVFAEFYTNLMPNLSKKRLERLIGKNIIQLTRVQLEEEGGRDMLNSASKGRVAFLVPGDPMVATTHVTLRLSLSKLGIQSRVVHGPSITSAVCGATGLQSYKFGKSVTVPFDSTVPGSILDAIADNYIRGLHTLILLDVKAGENRQMTIPDAIAKLIKADHGLEGRLAVGVARIGARDEDVKAAKMPKLVKHDFGKAPHVIIVPGRLHFMEAEALRVLCGADDDSLR